MSSKAHAVKISQAQNLAGQIFSGNTAGLYLRFMDCCSLKNSFFPFRIITQGEWHCNARLPALSCTVPLHKPHKMPFLNCQKSLLTNFPFRFFLWTVLFFFLFVNKETNKQKARMWKSSARTQLINNEHRVVLIISFCLSLTNWQ